jgi:hypothetical protein
MSSAWPHRCDEFPAEYSLASCSPAELASASSAAAMLQQQPSFVEVISANGNQGVLVLSQRRGSPHGTQSLGISPLPLSRFAPSCSVEMTASRGYVEMIVLFVR